MPSSRTRFTLVLACLLLAALPAAAQTAFSFQLFGQAERPPADTDAYGTCTGVLSDDESTFTLTCEHNVDEAVAAHVHRGFADENGPILFDLGTATSPIQATWDVDENEAIRLLAGGLYVNVHSMDFENGEIRGQIRSTQRVAGRSIAFKLSGDQEVPAVGTAASGACVADVEFDETPLISPSRVSFDLRCAHDVENATMAHIHLAERGAEGDVIVDLGSPVSPIEQSVEFTTANRVNAFFAGELYVNVHSEEEPDGEVRGQMESCIEGPNTLCLNDGRFTVQVDWQSGEDNGRGVAVKETGDSGLFWFFRPSNLEMLVKVLNACGVNQRYWVFLAATTNVGYTVAVTDNRSGFFKTYENTRGMNAVPELDTGAFPSCP